MLKLSKKADYGLIALKHLAQHTHVTSSSAAEIAEHYGISTQLMAKVLQKLARGGLVTAKHGATGGYTLAKDPAHITVLDALNAIDGPQFITSCVTNHGECIQSVTCTVREPLRRVNETIMHVLSGFTISQMTQGPGPDAVIELKAS